MHQNILICLLVLFACLRKHITQLLSRLNQFAVITTPVLGLWMLTVPYSFAYSIRDRLLTLIFADSSDYSYTNKTTCLNSLYNNNEWHNSVIVAKPGRFGIRFQGLTSCWICIFCQHYPHLNTIALLTIWSPEAEWWSYQSSKLFRED